MDRKENLLLLKGFMHLYFYYTRDKDNAGQIEPSEFATKKKKESKQSKMPSNLFHLG